MAFDLDSLSRRDQIWAHHKKQSETVAQYYQGTQFDAYSQRIVNCAERLSFQRINEELKLLEARFCRVRHCPICQWRRSLQWKARAFERIPHLVEDFPTDRWLFLTLTIRNCPLQELREHIELMHTAFKRLTRLKAWCTRGWIKSTEVTKGQDGLAHPHFHCLLMVPASYFSGKRYLSHEKWVQLWKQSLQADYTPVVDARAIKRTEDPTALIPEILKYQTKTADLISDSVWLLELTKQLHGTKAVALGGVVREYMNQSRGSYEDQKTGSDFIVEWNQKTKVYQETLYT